MILNGYLSAECFEFEHILQETRRREFSYVQTYKKILFETKSIMYIVHVWMKKPYLKASAQCPLPNASSSTWQIHEPGRTPTVYRSAVQLHISQTLDPGLFSIVHCVHSQLNNNKFFKLQIFNLTLCER